MDGRCETCRHWNRDHKNHYPSDYGVCALTVVMAGNEVRAGAKFWAMGTEYPEDDNQWIETKEDFGCVQWEVRP